MRWWVGTDRKKETVVVKEGVVRKDKVVTPVVQSLRFRTAGSS